MGERNVTLYVKIRIPDDTTPEQVRGEIEDVLLDMSSLLGGIKVDEVGIASYVLPEHVAEVTTEGVFRYSARRYGLADTEDPS